MSPIQELTEADLTPAQHTHLCGLIAIYLDTPEGITRNRWQTALIKAKGCQS